MFLKLIPYCHEELCSSCYRTFDGAEGKWSDSYFKEICLSDLDYDKVGKPSQVKHPGTTIKHSFLKTQVFLLTPFLRPYRTQSGCFRPVGCHEDGSGQGPSHPCGRLSDRRPCRGSRNACHNRVHQVGHKPCPNSCTNRYGI